jgi:hypothetical protein
MVAAMIPIYFSMYITSMGLGQGYSAQLIGSDLGTVTFACEGRDAAGCGSEWNKEEDRLRGKPLFVVDSFLHVAGCVAPEYRQKKVIRCWQNSAPNMHAENGGLNSYGFGALCYFPPPPPPLPPSPCEFGQPCFSP